MMDNTSLTNHLPARESSRHAGQRGCEAPPPVQRHRFFQLWNVVLMMLSGAVALPLQAQRAAPPQPPLTPLPHPEIAPPVVPPQAGSIWTVILGVVVVLLLLGYAVDSADGQLARLRSGGSLAGEWLDHCLDVVKVSALHLAVLISAQRFDADLGAWPQVAAFAFELVAVTGFFTFILTEQLRRRAATAPSSATCRRTRRSGRS